MSVKPNIDVSVTDYLNPPQLSAQSNFRAFSSCGCLVYASIVGFCDNRDNIKRKSLEI